MFYQTFYNHHEAVKERKAACKLFWGGVFITLLGLGIIFLLMAV